MFISNVLDIYKKISILRICGIGKYIKRLLGMPELYIKERLEINHLICVLKKKFYTWTLR